MEGVGRVVMWRVRMVEVGVVVGVGDVGEIGEVVEVGFGVGVEGVEGGKGVQIADTTSLELPHFPPACCCFSPLSHLVPSLFQFNDQEADLVFQFPLCLPPLLLHNLNLLLECFDNQPLRELILFLLVLPLPGNLLEILLYPSLQPVDFLQQPCVHLVYLHLVLQKGFEGFLEGSILLGEGGVEGVVLGE